MPRTAAKGKENGDNPENINLAALEDFMKTMQVQDLCPTLKSCVVKVSSVWVTAVGALLGTMRYN